MSVERPPCEQATDTRPIARAELDRVQAIERACFATPWPRSAFELAVRTPRILFRGVEAEGALAGYVVAVRDDEGVLIANVAVDPRARRKGLGTALMETAIDWGRRLRAPCCHLEVRVSNAGAIELYRRFGFRAAGIERRYYHDPVEDALSMRLPLRRDTP